MAETRRVPQELRNEIATIARDVTAPIAGFVLRPRDEVLATRGGGRGLAIYEDIKRDPHAGAVLRKRKMAVVAREWSVEPASDAPADVAAGELVEAAVKGLRFDRLCLGLLDCVLKGYAVAELIWGPVTIDGRTWILPVDAKVRNPRRFVFDRDGGLRLLTWQAPAEGEALPDRKFIVARFGEEDTEDPYGLGLGASLFWPVYFKRQGLAFWLVFADKFGNPTVLGEYPPDADDGQQTKLLSALAAISHDSGIIIPKGMEVRFLEAQRSGSINTHESLCRYMDEMISEAVLGETLTTNAPGRGTQALGTVHNEVREELTDADADLLSETLNDTLCRWIVEINMPGATPPGLWRRKADDEDLDKRAERDRKLLDAGLEPEEGPDYFERVYGDRWVRKAAAPPPLPGTRLPAVAFAEDGPAGPVADLAVQLDAAARDQVEALIAKVREAVASAPSWETLQLQLAAIAPGMAVDELAALLARAMAVAELTARGDVLDGD